MKENRFTVLVTQGDDPIRQLIGDALSADGYRVLYAANGSAGLSMAASHCPDIMLLALGLPDMDGILVLKSIRQWGDLPIIVVSARDDEQDKVLALDMGADDYITKPFGIQELLARVRLALRHHGAYREVGNRPGSYRNGGLLIDYATRRVQADGREVHLTQTEFKIVTMIARACGQIVTYGALVKALWGPHAASGSQALRVNMANIRKKIETEPSRPKYIITEVGVGYRMREHAEDVL